MSDFRRVFGASVGDLADRELCQAWILHWFPGVTVQTIGDYSISQLVDMHEFAVRSTK